jgi:hypothetical protein
MERRNYPRFETNASAKITCSTDSREKTVMLEEAGEQGVRVIGYEPFKASDDVKISFQIPYFCPHMVQKKARVIWSRLIAGKMWEAGLDFGTDNLINIPYM